MISVGTRWSSPTKNHPRNPKGITRGSVATRAAGSHSISSTLQQGFKGEKLIATLFVAISTCIHSRSSVTTTIEYKLLTINWPSLNTSISSRLWMVVCHMAAASSELIQTPTSGPNLSHHEKYVLLYILLQELRTSTGNRPETTAVVNGDQLITNTQEYSCNLGYLPRFLPKKLFSWMIITSSLHVSQGWSMSCVHGHGPFC